MLFQHRLGSINVTQTRNRALFSKTTLSCSKMYPAVQKNPPQEKIVKIKYVGTKILRINCFMFVFDTITFYEPWGTFLYLYESVIFENTALFQVWGSFIDPNLCWKSKFGSVNLLFEMLRFLPFYGLLAAFMAFLLKPMTFPE